MKELRAIIWDMDGVLVDTGNFHYKAWLSTLKDYSINFPWKKFQETFGMNNSGLIELLLGYKPPNGLVSEISEKKESKFRELIRGNISLIPDVKDWLEEASHSGLIQAVASSAPQANIDLILNELGIANYFSVILSAEEMPGKPDPAVFLKTAQSLNFAPEECLVIEDAIAGVTAAVRAGMYCLAVTNTNPAESLSEANYIVSKLKSNEYHIVVEKTTHLGKNNLKIR